ncbi:conserved unknown protein [Ectocarpus siliculosus]|uniref:Phosphodiesterase n=1 Tax=Ectocarpus siliculosus TaxID=2880 RepID=D7G095_ECTSI|nr:conserved unknown protein [Ectocarpus siliculosus]|eukprot:CBJ32977.1 conserved unknown protein [Ectocarpus siliculosus]
MKEETGARKSEPQPLRFEQIIELLESTAADSPLISPAALLCRVEGLLLRGTGATRADALLVDRWFNKLLHFSPATASGSGGGDGEAKGARETPSRDRRSFSDGDGGSQSREQLQQQQQQQQHEVAFNTRAVCDIGEGIAGMAAMTGRKLRLKDCSTRQQRRRGKALYGTEYTSGSVVCWPVSALPTEVGVTRAEAETSAFEQLEDVDGDDETEEARPSPGPAERVLAVLQVHCADGVLSAAAVEALHGLGRLLVPLLTEALARDEEYMRRRSTEALLSLSIISPRDVGLIAMVEEVVDAAQVMTEAERVCLFFVDDAEHKLWVATSVGFEDPKIKIGEGLCGHAAATGGTVNVIDSYEDPRFVGRWDKQTGFVTKGVLCVPIPPPAYAAASVASRAAAGGNGGGRRAAARPLAVLQLSNKRGRGVFNEHDENALIPDKKMWSFLRAVERRYPPNAFHNLTHAVSVTHASFTIVKTSRADSLLRPLDKLGLLVAAFCHDIDHPGNNNAYEVNSVSPLALQYGDSSVLERHHVFVTYQVLLEEGGANNIFSGLTRIQFRDVRQTIVQAILGTDMSGHMQHCADVFQFALKAKRLAAGGGERQDGLLRVPQKNFQAGGGGGRGGGGVGADRAAKSHTRPKATAARETSGFAEGMEGARGEGVVLLALARAPPSVLPSPPPEHILSVDKAEDRSFLTKTILHCADLSGQVLDNHLALEWGRRILDEFRLQARLEANTGLPRTTVASGDLETTIKGQHFFAEKIVKPLWEPFVALFPKLKPLLKSLNRNCEYYRQEGLRLERQRLSAASDSRRPQQKGQEGGGGGGGSTSGDKNGGRGDNGDGGDGGGGTGDGGDGGGGTGDGAGVGKEAVAKAGGRERQANCNDGGGG